MNKIELTEQQQLDEIKTKKGVTMIFKHSTRCPVSRMALKIVESDEVLEQANIDYYYLDLLKHRDISNEIASEYSIEHKSPQVLLIKEGKCFYNTSHSGIKPAEIIEQLN